MDLARVSRMVERDFFWALVGSLLAVVVVRVVLLVMPVNTWILSALLLIGAWTGVFLSHYSQRSDDVLFDSIRSQTPLLRALCLKVMLWLLGAATVIGVLTVLTASYDILGRVASTVLATAFAAGVLWPLSVMVDRSKTMASGLLGMASVLVVYCLVIPMIWDLDTFPNEMFALSLVIGLTTPLGMAALRMVMTPRTHLSGRMGIAVYLFVVICFCVAIWHPGSWRERSDWWATGWWTIAYGVLAAVCSIRSDSTWRRYWRWVGVLVSFFAWLIIMVFVWENQSSSSLPIELITLFTSIGVLVAHTNLVMQLSVGHGPDWLRMVTMGALAATALFLNLELNLDPQRGLSFLGRIAGAGGVIASCGTLAIFVISRLNRPSSPAIVEQKLDKEFSEIVLFCPGCNTKQSMQLGNSKCSECGLWIQTSVGR